MPTFIADRAHTKSTDPRSPWASDHPILRIIGAVALLGLGAGVVVLGAVVVAGRNAPVSGARSVVDLGTPVAAAVESEQDDVDREVPSVIVTPTTIEDGTQSTSGTTASPLTTTNPPMTSSTPVVPVETDAATLEPPLDNFLHDIGAATGEGSARPDSRPT